jgi:hypothetical protein
MRRWFWIVLYLLTGALLLGLAASGWEYYRLPVPQRLRHPLHWDLKPGGRRGLLYGVAGFASMLLMHVYSLRKRVRLLQRLGNLPTFLQLHMYLGILGPSLIVLHSAGKVGGLIGVAFWAMVVVSLSGFFGRFLYVQIPRTATGDQVSLATAQAMEAQLVAQLQRTDPQLLQLLQLREERPREERSLLLQLFALATLPWRLRVEGWRRLSRVPAPLRREARVVLEVARQKELLHRRLLLWQRLQDLFHYWHVLHKPMAALMYLLAVAHIAVAWLTGYARLVP